MRFRQILELLVDILDELIYKNCFGCRDKLENQQAHDCMNCDKWEYLEQALSILLVKQDITQEEYTSLCNLDRDE